MPTSRPDDFIFRRAIPIYKCNAPKSESRIAAGHPVNMAVNSTVGARRTMLKGRKMQPAKMNHAMIEMLRGRVGRCGAAIGGVGGSATLVGVAAPTGLAIASGVVSDGGGGVAECGMLMS